MSWVSVTRAIMVRLLFAVHGLVSIWLLVTVTRDNRFWYMASGLGVLLMEMTITLGKKGGKEWKWFCPSVFIYLTCVVPAIWFLELHEMDKRIEKRQTANLTAIAHQFLRAQMGENVTSPDTAENEEELSAHLGTVLGVSFEGGGCGGEGGWLAEAGWLDGGRERHLAGHCAGECEKEG
ncbi:hypothetical protein ACOMHN_011713 [Nucella lapillus]